MVPVLLLAPQFVVSLPAQTPHTYVLHLNGIGGKRIMDRWLMEGLEQGGVDDDYRIFDWTGTEQGMLALSDVELHQTQSAKVAAMIVAYREAHPDDRFILTSHSAGAGIAAWALEQLPANISIDTWVMLEPALSPRFDLSKALTHVTGHAYAFSSVNDVIVLDVGTKLMGTVDRVKSEAAGYCGFRMPRSGDIKQYAKLVSVPYEISWMRFGNVGDHIGCMLRPFAKHVIAPTLLDGSVPKFPPLVATTEPTAAP